MYPKNSFQTSSIDIAGIGPKSRRARRTRVFAEAFPCAEPFACCSNSHPLQSQVLPLLKPLEGWDAFPCCQAALLHPSTSWDSVLLSDGLSDKDGWKLAANQSLVHGVVYLLTICNSILYHHLFLPYSSAKSVAACSASLSHPIPSCHPHPFTDPGPFHSVLQVPLHFRKGPTFSWWKGDSLEVSEELEII